MLFRFRPPKGYEIDTLEAEQIFLCKPSVYEDSGDCEILFDLRDLCEYFMLERRTDFLVKPRAIVMGRNIERNLDFRDRVREYSSKSGIRLLKAQDIKK